MKQHEDLYSKRPSGNGGAHVRWSMFGARGPLLNKEGEGSGGSGGGGSGGEGGGAGGEGGGAGDGGEGGSGGDDGKIVMTQAELDKIVQDRVNRDRAARSKQQPPKQNPPPKPPANNSNADNSSDPTWVFDFQDAYDSVTDELGTKAATGMKKRMRDQFARERPSDPNAWVKSWFEDMGSKPPSTTNENSKGSANGTSSSKQGSEVKQPPVSDKGAANGGAREFDSITNPNDLTASDVERLIAKHGEEKANQMIGQMSVRWLSKTKLRIPRAQR